MVTSVDLPCCFGSYLFVGNLLGSLLSSIEINPLRPLVCSDFLKDVVYTSEQC